MAEEYEEIGQLQLWKPAKEGEVLEGVVLSKRTHAQFGDSWGIETPKGEIQTPSHKVLQNRMQNVNVGDSVRITFQGLEAPKLKGQSPMAMYKVERKKKQ